MVGIDNAALWYTTLVWGSFCLSLALTFILLPMLRSCQTELKFPKSRIGSVQFCTFLLPLLTHNLPTGKCSAKLMTVHCCQWILIIEYWVLNIKYWILKIEYQTLLRKIYSQFNYWLWMWLSIDSNDLFCKYWKWKWFVISECSWW